MNHTLMTRIENLIKQAITDDCKLSIDNCVEHNFNCSHCIASNILIMLSSKDE